MTPHIETSDCRAGYSLPARFYGDADIYVRDHERIIAPAWHIVDHVSAWTSAGDVKTWTVSGESLITVRDEDSRIRTFYNVCRHRGSRICLEPWTHGKRIACKYHGWTYDLDGRLRSATGLPPEVDRKTLALQAVNTIEYHGLVLVSLDAGASTANLAKLDPYFEGADLAHTRVAARHRFDVEANWKLVVENFLECYHCYGAHPEYMSVNSRESVMAISRGDRERLRLVNAASAKPSALPPLAEPDQTFAVQRPLRTGYCTGSRNGRPVAALLGGKQAYDGLATVIGMNPFAWLSIYNDYAVFYRFVPQSAQSTEVEAVWLVKESAVENVDYRVEELTWLWRETLAQDKQLVLNNQLGVRSAAYRPGPYCADEHPNIAFTQWYLDKIRA